MTIIKLTVSLLACNLFSGFFASAFYIQSVRKCAAMNIKLLYRGWTKLRLLFIGCMLTIAFQLVTFNSFAQYTKLLDFAGTPDGGNPRGSLISDGTFLYGMTTGGGTNGMGTIFKIMPDGTGFVKLLDFNGITAARAQITCTFDTEGVHWQNC